MSIIQRISGQPLLEAFALMHELRPALDYETFLARLERQEQNGYELYGSIHDRLVGLIGFRTVETMARGPHLHIDDLIVANDRRHTGIGRQLIEYVEDIATTRGVACLFLDSRLEVINFYKHLGYAIHNAQLMYKRF
jgi:ribosomal protein S18 acetylase RimI-like enzyme